MLLINIITSFTGRNCFKFLAFLTILMAKKDEDEKWAYVIVGIIMVLVGFVAFFLLTGIWKVDWFTV